MTRRIRIPLLLDVVMVDDVDQLTTLNRHPAISRVISGHGGLAHRMIQRRIYGTLTVGATPLPVFAGRDDPDRVKAQVGLEAHLTGPVPGEVVPRGAIEPLARYVAGEDIGEPIGVAVQQLIGRMFVPGYAATVESWEAARVIDAWPRANPLKALWWRCTGKLRRSKALIWRLANNNPACIHSTAIALHNVVGALERMREPVAERHGMTAEEVVAACMVTPAGLLRSCTATVEVPFLRKPLRRGTLIMFRLAKIHEAVRTNAVSFAENEWNQCPGHSVVPRLLQAVWTASLAYRGSLHVHRPSPGSSDDS